MAMVSTGSCTVAVGGADNGMSGGAIRDPAGALREGRDKMGGVDLDNKGSNNAYARSIKGSDILHISSRSPNTSDKVGRSSRGMDTFGISYLPKYIETM